MSGHPEWCGAHPSVRYNDDWCDECDETFDDATSDCLEQHPEAVHHKRELNLGGLQGAQGWNVWLSQRPGEKLPRLWSGYELEEDDAEEISLKEFSSVLSALQDVHRAMQGS